MQLVPLSTDGRVVAVACTVAVVGSLRVALEPDRGGVGVVALGSGVSRPVARLAAPDAAAFRPVLQSLWTQGLVGSCPALVTATGQLVLHLAPAPECVLGNSSAGLVLLAARRTVAVTREEHHQGVLVGRSGRVAVALTPCTIATGKHAGQRGIEVLLDGRRIGELAGRMSQRYLPMVDELAARGRRAGCEAVLRPGDRGVQVELRLPEVDTAGGGAAPAPSSPPMRYPGTVVAAARGASTAVAPTARRAGPGVPPRDPAATVAIPRQRAAPEPTRVAPAHRPVPETHPRRGRRRAWWAGAATVGVLLVATGVGASAKSDTAPATAPAAASSAPASPGPSATDVVPVPATTITASAGATARRRSKMAGTTTSRRSSAVGPTARTTTSMPPGPETNRPVTTRSATIRPAVTTRPRPPAPAPAPAQPSECDPNYSGCVPVATDVDCAGGGGDGPAYVRGPVRVIGKDIYGLDRGGEPGVGCG